MGIKKGEKFSQQDIYIDYQYEEVMYRWDHKAEKLYVKFYGENEKSEPVPHDNKLFNDALLSGREITKDAYTVGNS